MTETALFIVAIASYLLAFGFYCISLSMHKKRVYNYARFANWVGALAGLVALGLRWKTAGHPPLSNMYESMVTLSTFVVLAGVCFTRNHPLALLEAGSSVLAIMMIGISSLFPSEVTPLIPALQSKWLHVHVSLAFLGESCFAVAFILSYMYCLRRILGDASGKTNFENTSEKIACYVVTIGLPIIFEEINTGLNQYSDSVKASLQGMLEPFTSSVTDATSKVANAIAPLNDAVTDLGGFSDKVRAVLCDVETSFKPVEIVLKQLAEIKKKASEEVAKETEKQA